MTISSSQPCESQNVRAFAWRVAAKRESAINVVLNGLIAAVIYGRVGQMTLVAGWSLLSYLGPMSFLLPTIATFFGYFNGVAARRAGLGSPWPAGARWKRTAIIHGLLRSCVLCPACILACWALHGVFPAVEFPAWGGVAIISAVSGIAGYFLHGSAVMASFRLGQQLSTTNAKENETPRDDGIDRRNSPSD